MSYYGAPAPGGYAPPGYAPPAAPGGYGAPRAPPFNPWATPGWAPRDPTTWAIFQAVDTDRSGSIKLAELVAALTNGGYSKFGVRTARYLMRMFDSDRSGVLGYQEFEQLMEQIRRWRAHFDAADRDRSGSLSQHEVFAALRTFGFSLPDAVCTALMAAFDEDKRGTLTFDEFVGLLAEVTALTTQFRRYDTAGRGTATLDFTSFLQIVYSTRS